jgi:hypothetical protein
MDPLPSAAHRFGWSVLLVMLAIYVALFAWTYPPPIAGIEDEAGFINQAFVFAHGAVSAEGAGYGSDLFDFVSINGRTVSKRNLGRSLVCAGMIDTIGPRSIFWSGAVCHVALVLIAGAIFVRLGSSPLWAALVLFHPTLALYSRTIMGDTPTALCLLAAYWAYVRFRRPGIWIGLFIGLAAVMRYQAGIELPIVAAALWLERSVDGRRREAIGCLLTGGAIGVLLGIYNHIVYGSALGWTKQGYFSLSFVPGHLAFYAVALLVIWPGMLIAPFVDRSHRRLVTLAFVLPILCLFIPYYFIDAGPSFGQTLILGQRLIEPIIPIMIVSYGVMVATWIAGPVGRKIGTIGGRVIGVGASLVGLALIAGIFRAHENHLRQLNHAAMAFEQAVPDGSTVLLNTTLGKLVGTPLGGKMYHLVPWNTGTAFPDVAAFVRAHPDGYVAMLPKGSKDEYAADVPAVTAVATPVETGDGLLMLYRAGGP